MINNIYVYDPAGVGIEGKIVSLVYFNTDNNAWEVTTQETDVDGYVELDDNGYSEKFFVIQGDAGENSVVKKVVPVLKVYG